MHQFIKGLPKAELHVHIEGTLEPDMLLCLANKHGVSLSYATVEEVRRAYDFKDLQSFLDIYYAGANVLLDQDDFYELTMAYLRRMQDEGVVHVEMFFDPQTHTRRGVVFADVITGIHRALGEGERRFGITHRLILCFLRDLSADEAMQTLEEALPFVQWLAAVGLDSAEVGNPPAKFASVFSRARTAGLHAVAHAGEEGPPSYIWEALDVLRVRRIDHGVRCEEDPQLLQRLMRERIPLTVCPLSNVKLKVFERLDQHNLKRLLDAGVCVTLNSDDPAYFGGYLAANYSAAKTALALSNADLKLLARNSFEASFLSSDDIDRWSKAIEVYEG